VPELYDGDQVEADLALIRADPLYSGDADLLSAFLDELGGNEDALWKLCKWEAEYSSPWFDCKAITCFQSAGLNMYRLKPLTNRLRRYRILYAYDAAREEFHILAIVVRKPAVMPQGASPDDYYDYEPDHPVSVRATREYDSIGLPRVH
jgi:hypothetical protein